MTFDPARSDKRSYRTEQVEVTRSASLGRTLLQAISCDSRDCAWVAGYPRESSFWTLDVHFPGRDAASIPVHQLHPQLPNLLCYCVLPVQPTEPSYVALGLLSKLLTT